MQRVAFAVLALTLLSAAAALAQRSDPPPQPLPMQPVPPGTPRPTTPQPPAGIRPAPAPTVPAASPAPMATEPSRPAALLPPITAPEPESPIRADLYTAKPVYSPSEPIRIRFTLTNTTAGVLDIPLQKPWHPGEALSLPEELLFGLPGKPTLRGTVANDRPTALGKATSQPASDQAASVLRLAPGATLGAELDLRQVDRQARYSGEHDLEWRPLADSAPARLQFRIEPRKNAVLVTDLGKMTFSLAYETAPVNVANFLELARRQFYDGLSFHRVVPGFILQGGSPNSEPGGQRPDGKTVRGEFTRQPVVAGTLLMARKPNDPDSASCQIFIALDRLEELDGQYTIIGQARDDESLATLQKLGQVPVDEQDAPVRPLVIRFFTLIDESLIRPETILNR